MILEWEGANWEALMDIFLCCHDGAKGLIQDVCRQSGNVCLSPHSFGLNMYKDSNSVLCQYVHYILPLSVFLSVFYLCGGRFCLAKITYYVISPV